MAQEERRHAWSERLLRYFGQHPMVVAGVMCAMLALGFAGVSGVTRARDYGGFAIESASSEEADRSSGSGGDGAEQPEGKDGGDVDDSEGTEIPRAPEVLIVDVAGAVRRPCVVELSPGARVRDAIDAAGGLREDADVSAVNRAAPLADGQQIYVPCRGEAPRGVESPGREVAENGVAGGPVNINTADIEALDALPGVGPSTARAIIDERTQNGPFASIEDIMRVTGIGEKKFEKLKGSICV